jgi:hypothetical protein
MLLNLNPAATLAAMQGYTLPPGAVRARVIAPAKTAKRKAKAAHEGPFQDTLGRWHWQNGRMMARVDAQGLGLSWLAPAPRKAQAAPKRTGPFLDVRGRWHHATGAFMSNAQAMALGLIRVS